MGGAKDLGGDPDRRSLGPKNVSMGILKAKKEKNFGGSP